MTTLDFFLVILIILAGYSIVLVTIYLKKITEQMQAVKKDIHDFIEKTNPVIENLEEITRRASRVVSEVESYWEEIDNSIKKVRERFSGLTSIKNFREVEYPAKDLINNIRAFAKGASAFWNAFKHR